MRLPTTTALLALLLVSPPARAADEDYAAMTTAAREVSRQMYLFQDLYGSDNRLQMLGGIFGQSIDFLKSLDDFRMAVNNKAPREQIRVAFDTVDKNLNAILAEVKAAERDNAALRLVCRRLRNAENDLHFAVYSGDTTDASRAQRLYRQTLSQIAYIESLGDSVNYILAADPNLPAWKEDMAKLRQSLASLQRTEEQKGVTAADIKDQFVSADKAWSSIITRYEGLNQNKLLLQPFVGLVERGFARMAPLAGVANREGRGSGFSE